MLQNGASHIIMLAAAQLRAVLQRLALLSISSVRDHALPAALNIVGLVIPTAHMHLPRS